MLEFLFVLYAITVFTFVAVGVVAIYDWIAAKFQQK